MPDMDTKARTMRLGRVAKSCGLMLRKTRRLNPRMADHGLYRLLDATGTAVFTTYSLDEIEAELTRRTAEIRAGQGAGQTQEGGAAID